MIPLHFRLASANQLKPILLNISRLLSNLHVNTFTERSHTCGQLTSNDVGLRVTLFGWVKFTRFDNKIITLRDSYGTVQCVVDKNKLTKSFRKTAITNESVIKVSGLVQARPENQRKESQTSGDIEVLVNEVDILSLAKKDLPILTRESDPEQSVKNRLKYRYLDIRGKNLQEALRFRSRVCQVFRRSLDELGFIECETPTLFRRTPGGANEFMVPTQIADKFYGLTQSPQQLKQLLMIGGLDRYFQICRCYRDESIRSDRQPEFTQLDIELSFTNQQQIMNLVNHLIHELFRQLKKDGELNDHLESHFFDENQIDTISFHEAFRDYGTDKPDTRFGWLLEDSADSDISLDVPQPMESDFVDSILDEVNNDNNLTTSGQRVSAIKSDHLTKFTIHSRDGTARKSLGQLRLKIAAKLDQSGRKIYDTRYKFLWVTDFPLLVKKDDTKELEPNHHPFTAPTADTIQYLQTDPLKVKGQHYDLVLNGQEVAGGSIRIHHPELQKLIFNDIMNLEDETFEYFTEALSSGCPPHGGIAIGLDRLIAILLGRDTIRDVIAFPKTSSGRDLMSGCPHEIDSDTKSLYHISSNKG